MAPFSPRRCVKVCCFTCLPLLLLLAMVVGVLPVQADVPQLDAPTPARHILDDWLSVFNAADTAAMQSFVAAHYSEQQRRGMSAAESAKPEMDFRQRVGGFDLVKVESNSQREIRAILRERGGEKGYAAIQLQLAENSPDIIESLGLRRIPAPAESGSGAALSDTALVSDTAAFLESLSSTGQFSGTVLIAKHGDSLLARAYGLADRDKHEPNRMDTKFDLGSLDKMFTAVAIAQLVEQRKFSFTDTIAKVLPDFPNAEVARRVTIHQLLTHTSGLGDYFGPDFQA